MCAVKLYAHKGHSHFTRVLHNYPLTLSSVINHALCRQLCEIYVCVCVY
jgi:hypothetical protein